MKYNFYLLRTKKTVNDIRYIGVTTNPINVRYSQHKYEANMQRDLPVYHWWRKRIAEGYSIIIELIESNFIGDWEEREQYWIRHYKQMGFNLLNVSKGGSGVVTNDKRSIDSRMKTINAHKKPVIALTLDGKFYKEYPSCNDAAIEFNTVHTSITNACKNRWSHSSHGYLWIFKSDYDPEKKYEIPDSGWVPCYKFDLTGKFIQKYQSIAKCAKEEHVDERRLRNHINQKFFLRGFIYSTNKNINITEYIDNTKYTVFKYDINNNLICKYKTLTEFWKTENFSPYKYYQLKDRSCFSLDTGEIIKVL